MQENTAPKLETKTFNGVSSSNDCEARCRKTRNCAFFEWHKVDRRNALFKQSLGYLLDEYLENRTMKPFRGSFQAAKNTTKISMMIMRDKLLKMYYAIQH